MGAYPDFGSVVDVLGAADVLAVVDALGAADVLAVVDALGSSIGLAFAVGSVGSTCPAPHPSTSMFGNFLCVDSALNKARTSGALYAMPSRPTLCSSTFEKSMRRPCNAPVI